MRPCTRSTLHHVKSKMCLHTWSTLRHVKSGSFLTLQEVLSPPPWSTLRQVKSGPCPRTRSTLCWARTRSHPQFHLVFQSLYSLVSLFSLVYHLYHILHHLHLYLSPLLTDRFR